MDALMNQIPAQLRTLVIVLLAVQLVLQLFALLRLIRTPDSGLVFGKKWPWLLIILLGESIGAIVFLAAGRKPVAATDPLQAAQPVVDQRAERAADVLYGPKGGDES